MKRLLIVTTLLISIAASTFSCCFNPFFYLPLEGLNVSDTDTQPVARSIETDAAPLETDQSVLNVSL